MGEQRGSNVIGSWDSQWESSQLFKTGRSSYRARKPLVRTKLHPLSKAH